MQSVSKNMADQLEDIPEREREPLNDPATNPSKHNGKRFSQGQCAQVIESIQKSMSWWENVSTAQMGPDDCQAEAVEFAAEWQGHNGFHQ